MMHIETPPIFFLFLKKCSLGIEEGFWPHFVIFLVFLVFVFWSLSGYFLAAIEIRFLWLYFVHF